MLAAAKSRICIADARQKLGPHQALAIGLNIDVPQGYVVGPNTSVYSLLQSC